MFVVYLSAVPVEQVGVSHGYLAYWNDASTEQLYVYGRRLFDEGDVGHALLNLVRDLGVQVGPLVAEIGELADSVAMAGSEIDDPTVWSPASYELLLYLMGFDPEPESSADSVAGGGSGTRPTAVPADGLGGPFPAAPL